jgi:hypothetical protein
MHGPQVPLIVRQTQFSPLPAQSRWSSQAPEQVSGGHVPHLPVRWQYVPEQHSAALPAGRESATQGPHVPFSVRQTQLLPLPAQSSWSSHAPSHVCAGHLPQIWSFSQKSPEQHSTALPAG